MTQFKPIKELAEQIRGVSYAKEDASTTPEVGYIAILRAGNITNDEVTLGDLVYVPRARVTDNQLIRQHDVLVATSSGSLTVVGKAAQATEDLDAGFGAFCKVLRPNKTIHPRYFAHFFRTTQYRQIISQLAAGANINNLRNEHLDELLIPVPSPPEQRRIADILDKADTIRRKRKEAMALTEELLRSTFLEMFGDPVTNPKGWPKSTFGEQLELLEYGPRFYDEKYTDTGVRIVRITDLSPRGELDYNSMPRLSVEPRDRARYTLQPGDIIFARSGATVGKTALITDEDPNAIAGAYFIRLRLKSSITPLYARQVLANERMQQIIVSRSRQSAQQNFSGPGIRELPLPLPPHDLQTRFLRIAKHQKQLQQRLHLANEATERLLGSLTQQAFRGDLLLNQQTRR